MVVGIARRDMPLTHRNGAALFMSFAHEDMTMPLLAFQAFVNKRPWRAMLFHWPLVFRIFYC